MVIGGLWHGAAWTFVIWGAFHGAWLALHRVWLARFPPPADAAGIRTGRGVRLLGIAATFHLVCLGWVFFRAESIGKALELLGALGHRWEATDFLLTGISLMGFFLGPWLAFELWIEKKGNSLASLKSPWPVRAFIYLYILLMLLFFASPEPVEFLYFQF
jgi:hypothetical protein